MPEKRVAKEGDDRAGLDEELSAHLILPRDVHVDVYRYVVTLTGDVETTEQREEVEREVRSIGHAHTVVNCLRVAADDEPQRLQTIIAVFSSKQAGRLAWRVVSSWQLYDDHAPELLVEESETRACLEERARAAQVPIEAVQHYLKLLKPGTCLLVDRVPEDEACRVISALNQLGAESIRTLPPEPDSVPWG